LVRRSADLTVMLASNLGEEAEPDLMARAAGFLLLKDS
jgi:hypothetical protein